MALAWWVLLRRKHHQRLSSSSVLDFRVLLRNGTSCSWLILHHCECQSHSGEPRKHWESSESNHAQLEAGCCCPVSLEAVLAAWGAGRAAVRRSRGPWGHRGCAAQLPPRVPQDTFSRRAEGLGQTSPVLFLSRRGTCLDLYNSMFATLSFWRKWWWMGHTIGNIYLIFNCRPKGRCKHIIVHILLHQFCCIL